MVFYQYKLTVLAKKKKFSEWGQLTRIQMTSLKQFFCPAFAWMQQLSPEYASNQSAIIMAPNNAALETLLQLQSDCNLFDLFYYPHDGGHNEGPLL